MISPFEIRLLESAGQELKTLDRSVAENVSAKLAWLAENASQIRHRQLTGPLAGLCRLRSGDYRVIYQVLTAERTILVHAIGHRSEIYRRE